MNNKNCPTCTTKFHSDIFNIELHNSVNNLEKYDQQHPTFDKIIRRTQNANKEEAIKKANIARDLFIKENEEHMISPNYVQFLKKYLKKTQSLETLFELLNKSETRLYFTSMDYDEIVSKLETHRGNEVWKIKYKFMIDIWNSTWDGMDHCFNACSRLNLCIPENIYEIDFVLNSKISDHANCCKVNTYVKNN